MLKQAFSQQETETICQLFDEVMTEFRHGEPFPGEKRQMMDYPAIKVAMYLDPVGTDDGCLRVIPGSHKTPFSARCIHLYEHREEPPAYPFGVQPDEIPHSPLGRSLAMWSSSASTCSTHHSAAVSTDVCSP